MTKAKKGKLRGKKAEAPQADGLRRHRVKTAEEPKARPQVGFQGKCVLNPKGSPLG